MDLKFYRAAYNELTSASRVSGIFGQPAPRSFDVLLPGFTPYQLTKEDFPENLQAELPDNFRWYAAVPKEGGKMYVRVWELSPRQLRLLNKLYFRNLDPINRQPDEFFDMATSGVEDDRGQSIPIYVVRKPLPDNQAIKKPEDLLLDKFPNGEEEFFAHAARLGGETVPLIEQPWLNRKERA